MTDKDVNSEHEPGMLKRCISSSLTYVKNHIFVTLTSFTMMISGIVYAQIYFPELPTYKIIFGGAFFGLFCAACALGYRLFEID